MADARITERRNRFEIYNTIILAIATLSVAWCSYQSTLWNGIQTFRLAESNKYGRLSQQNVIQAGQRVTLDQSIIISFINAVIDKNDQRIKLILKGTGELSPIMSEWLQLYNTKDSTAPLHPMLMPAYRDLLNKRMAASEKLNEKANELFDQADKANRIADNYTLFTVLFSMVMFLGAIATKTTRPQVSIALVTFAGLICVFVLIILFSTMPITYKG